MCYYHDQYVIMIVLNYRQYNIKIYHNSYLMIHVRLYKITIYLYTHL